MSDPMAEIKASFFIECEELLESLQDGLQVLYDEAQDDDTINVVFRAVHSIKGGAGAFGLDDLVAFAHRFETALDEVRSGTLALNSDILKLFFTCSDILGDLVRESRDEVPHDPARVAPIFKDLDDLLGAPQNTPDVALEFEPAALDLDFGLEDFSGAEDDPGWKITFRPFPKLYESGNEPLFLLKGLRDLGEYSAVCDETRLPDLGGLDPEASYLQWNISVKSPEPKTAIREAFDFVDGLCDLTISGAPTAEIEDLPDLASLSGDDAVGEPPMSSPAIAPMPVDSASKDVESSGPIKAPPKVAEKKPAPTPRATVRVDLDRIDRLVNLVGEIVINQAMLSQSVEAAGIPPNSPVRTGLEEFQQLTRDIQESVMMIRAQPVKSLFQRMSRIVREASSDVGKDVRLRTDGENTEVDKTVIERLADPLTHMIRNAVDHGLEPTEVRMANDKTPEGNVYLTASHRSGRVVIEVADDGAGINREKVLQKAIDKDLVPMDAQLSDSEIDNLLFLPGFSTADEVSSLSGRGVGMDVVRSSIQSLGGRITIQSEPGSGTKFSISLPLTLAVLDGMVVTVANETLVVPLNAIVETLALTSDDLRALGPMTHVVNIRDQFVPLVDLGAELGYRSPLADYSGKVVLLIGQEDGSSSAVIVDSIKDQRQVVIKGLHESYGRVPGIAAATILGDGQIALILDPIDLISNAQGATRVAEPNQKPDQEVALERAET